MTVYELDAELRTGESGITIYKDIDAINQKIKLWMSIHKGQLWGKPWWGNNISQFQFMSPTPIVLSVLEMEIAETIQEQLPIRVINITCDKATSRNNTFVINLVYQINETGRVGVLYEEFLPT